MLASSARLLLCERMQDRREDLVEVLTVALAAVEARASGDGDERHPEALGDELRRRGRVIGLLQDEASAAASRDVEELGDVRGVGGIPGFGSTWPTSRRPSQSARYVQLLW
jgi:hypothetical protein